MAKAFIVFLLFCFATVSGRDSNCSGINERIAAQWKNFEGLQERTGKNDHPVITAINRRVGATDRASYCASWVDSVLAAAGVCITPMSAWSPSFFPKARNIMWAKKMVPGKRIELGDVIGLWFRNLGRIGHVGFWKKQIGDMVNTAEANTSATINEGEQTRNGQGIEIDKWRHKSQIYSVSRWKDCGCS